MCGRRSKRAFTLIELLVVIAIIALLIGILLPSLGAARDTARSVVCQGSRLRSMATGQAQYILDNEDYYAGPNTTGFYDSLYYRLELVAEGKLTRNLPSTLVDWISPILGESMNMSDNRATRHANIFNTLGDPASVFYNDEIFPGGRNTTPDFNEFEDVLEDQGYRQTSYMSPATMHYYPSFDIARRHQRTVRGIRNSRVRRTPKYFWPFTIEFRAPDTFTPRIDRVAIQPSSKIIVTDATRYYDPELRSLDFDPNPTPGIYGSFTCSSPAYHESTSFGREFGRRFGVPGDQTNLQLSFRHPGNTINVGKFDGSTETIPDYEAWSDPAPWFPSGSTYTRGNAPTPEIDAKFDLGDKLP